MDFSDFLGKSRKNSMIHVHSTRICVFFCYCCTCYVNADTTDGNKISQRIILRWLDNYVNIFVWRDWRVPLRVLNIYNITHNYYKLHFRVYGPTGQDKNNNFFSKYLILISVSNSFHTVIW